MPTLRVNITDRVTRQNYGIRLSTRRRRRRHHGRSLPSAFFSCRCTRQERSRYIAFNRDRHVCPYDRGGKQGRKRRRAFSQLPWTARGLVTCLAQTRLLPLGLQQSAYCFSFTRVFVSPSVALLLAGSRAPTTPIDRCHGRANNGWTNLSTRPR